MLYRFSRKHDRAAIDRLLAGYKGYLIADGHSVDDHLCRIGDGVEVACSSCADVFLQGVPLLRTIEAFFGLAAKGERQVVL